MYNLFIAFYRKFRVLSIDIVFAALSVGLMSTKVLSVNMQTAWWIVLALSVWIIYTSDHLIDSNKLGDSASSERRLFYHKNFKLILIIVVILILVTSFISFLFLEIQTVYFGIAMSLFVAVYLLVIQLKGSDKIWWLQKELIVAIVYVFGIWGAPILYGLNKITISEMILVFTFIQIVWADILIIALYELKNDKQDKFTSLPIIIGKKKTELLILFLLIESIFLSVMLLFIQETRKEIVFAVIIMILMIFIMLFMLKKQSYFKHNERYRLVAEAVFFLPILMILV